MIKRIFVIGIVLSVLALAGSSLAQDNDAPERDWSP